MSASLHLRTGELDHLRPLFGLISEMPSKVSGRPLERRSAQFSQACIDFGVCQRSIDFLVQLLDDLGRRVLGSANTPPRASLISRYYSPTVGRSGKASDRDEVVIANGRTLPALMYCMDAGRLSKSTCTCPSMSVNAATDPR
jgi:hypothetical protein